MKHKTLAIAATFTLLVGCASTPKVTPTDLSPAPNPDEVESAPQGECPVWIYRSNTSFHSLNPELPYVYVNDVRVGRLGVGRTFCMNLKPGKYEIAIREPIMFIPAHTSGTLVVEVSEGSTQFVRYSREMSGITVVTPGAVSFGSSKKIQLTTKQAWQDRL